MKELADWEKEQPLTDSIARERQAAFACIQDIHRQALAEKLGWSSAQPAQKAAASFSSCLCGDFRARRRFSYARPALLLALFRRLDQQLRVVQASRRHVDVLCRSSIQEPLLRNHFPTTLVGRAGRVGRDFRRGVAEMLADSASSAGS